MGFFVAANVLLIVALSGAEASVGPRSTHVLALWSYAFGIVALGALLVARVLPADRRRRFLGRHMLLALLPVMGFVLRPEPAEEPRWWAMLYAALALLFTVHCVAALWSVAARTGDRRIAVVLGGALLAGQLALVPYTTLAIMPEADEPHYLILAQSIAMDRDLDLTNDYRRARYGAFYPGRLTDRHAIQVGPRLYPIRDLGLPIASALPFAIAGRPGVLIFIAVIAALVIAQLYLLLRDLRFAPGIAVLATGSVALSHPFHAYATQIYPEMLVALFGLLAVRLMRRGSATSVRDAMLAATVIAALPWFTTRAWFFALGLALVLGFLLLRPLFDRGTRTAAARRLLAATVPGAAIIAALLAYNWTLFGLAIPGAGFYLVSDQQEVLSSHPLIAAGGLFFGRTFGLIGRAPIYLLVFVGLATVLRRARGHGPEVAGLVLGWSLHFAFIASLEHWHSDWSPPSRNLVATIPFLAVGLAAGLETLLGSIRRLALGLIGTVAAWSLLIALIFGAQPDLRYELPQRLRESGAPARLWVQLQNALGGLEISGALPRTIVETTTTIPLLAAWASVAILLAVWGWLLARRSSAQPS